MARSDWDSSFLETYESLISSEVENLLTLPSNHENLLRKVIENNLFLTILYGFLNKNPKETFYYTRLLSTTQPGIVLLIRLCNSVKSFQDTLTDKYLFRPMLVKIKENNTEFTTNLLNNFSESDEGVILLELLTKDNLEVFDNITYTELTELFYHKIGDDYYETNLLMNLANKWVSNLLRPILLSKDLLMQIQSTDLTNKYTLSNEENIVYQTSPLLTLMDFSEGQEMLRDIITERPDMSPAFAQQIFTERNKNACTIITSEQRKLRTSINELSASYSQLDIIRRTFISYLRDKSGEAVGRFLFTKEDNNLTIKLKDSVDSAFTNTSSGDIRIEDILRGPLIEFAEDAIYTIPCEGSPYLEIQISADDKSSIFPVECNKLKLTKFLVNTLQDHEFQTVNNKQSNNENQIGNFRFYSPLKRLINNKVDINNRPEQRYTS